MYKCLLHCIACIRMARNYMIYIQMTWHSNIHHGITCYYIIGLVSPFCSKFHVICLLVWAESTTVSSPLEKYGCILWHVTHVKVFLMQCMTVYAMISLVLLALHEHSNAIAPVHCVTNAIELQISCNDVTATRRNAMALWWRCITPQYDHQIAPVLRTLAAQAERNNGGHTQVSSVIAKNNCGTRRHVVLT